MPANPTFSVTERGSPECSLHEFVDSMHQDTRAIYEIATISWQRSLGFLLCHDSQLAEQQWVLNL